MGGHDSAFAAMRAAYGSSRIRDEYLITFAPLMIREGFPTKDKYVARAVTELDFDLKEDIGSLGFYVDLSAVRSNKFRDDILYQLAVENGQLVRLSTDYEKILFSGHKGCGKTTELRRLHNELNRPDAYFSILVELEKETYLSRFEPEDLFVLLLLKLLEEIKERDLNVRSIDELDELAKEWLSDEETRQEVFRHNKRVSSFEGMLSIDMLLGLKGGLQSMWTAGSNTTNTIRTKIRQNPNALINRFNLFLGELRLLLEDADKGKDVIFIVDGSEKMRSQTYTDLFINDSVILRQLLCNMIVAVPIDAYYTIENSPARAFTHSSTIPMVKMEQAGAKDALRTVIDTRLHHDTFFAKGVLDHFVEYSGGCVRQLLQLVNQGLMRARGGQISMEHAIGAVDELGQRMYEQLNLEHLEVLRRNDPDSWPPGEVAVRALLFNLSLLKYNGKSGINPLLRPKLNLK